MRLIYIELMKSLKLCYVGNFSKPVYLCEVCVNLAHKVKDIVDKHDLASQSSLDASPAITPGQTPTSSHHATPHVTPKLSAKRIIEHTPTPRIIKKITTFQSAPDDHTYTKDSISSICDYYHCRNWLHNLDKEVHIPSNIASIGDLVNYVIEHKDIRMAVETGLAVRMSSELDKISNNSVLRQKGQDLVDNDVLHLFMKELEQCCPSILSLLSSLTLPMHRPRKNEHNTVLAMCAMIVNARNSQFCAVQRLMTATCLRHHAGNEVRGHTCTSTYMHTHD